MHIKMFSLITLLLLNTPLAYGNQAHCAQTPRQLQSLLENQNIAPQWSKDIVGHWSVFKNGSGFYIFPYNGRYVFAIGGNPEAAELAGINTKWVTVKIFALMGFLCGLSAVIASARLNSATNNLGTLDELYVIAAAVIGGTSFAGGIGTIYGAILGAIVMQSLQTGMVLIGFDAAIQQMVVGSVLVVAVWLDTMYRRRAK